MELTKVLALLFMLAVTVTCRRDFDDDDFDSEGEYEYENDDEDIPEDVEGEDEEVENKVEDPVVPPKNPNLAMCDNVKLPCSHCSGCFPGGWCIKNPGTKPKCLCNYGWTGPKAVWVPNTNDPAWGINRIRADNCLKPCHYTHHVRNKTCVYPFGNPHPHPVCDSKCGHYQGTCNKATGKCECCRGWTGPGGVYDHKLGTYTAKYCNKECPFLGVGIPNSHCKKAKDNVPACNPKCHASGGKCLKNGRCLCCLGWTGPHAHSVHAGHHKGKIVADYCDVYCPYTLHRPNKLCVVPDYVNRRRAAGHMIYV